MTFTTHDLEATREAFRRLADAIIVPVHELTQQVLAAEAEQWFVGLDVRTQVAVALVLKESGDSPEAGSEAKEEQAQGPVR